MEKYLPFICLNLSIVLFGAYMFKFMRELKILKARNEHLENQMEVSFQGLHDNVVYIQMELMRIEEQILRRDK